MQSLIADYAKTQAEYLLLAVIVAATDSADNPVGLEETFRQVLIEYRELPATQPQPST